MELSQSPVQKQQDELAVLKSIFPPEDFLPPPTQNVWKVKGPPEFMLRIRHPRPDCAETVGFNMHVAFTNYYPINPPILRIQKPASGLTEQHLDMLQKMINVKAKELLGNAMIYDIYLFCLDWLNENVKPSKPFLSLASEMSHRAEQEQEALRLRREEEAHKQRQEEEWERERLAAELDLDSLRKKEVQRVERQRARRRGPSDSKEAVQTVEVPVEMFNKKIEVQLTSGAGKVIFDSVMTFNPRAECFGIMWQAEPVCEPPRGLVPLALHVVNFEGSYYGRRKLENVERELQALCTIRHPNLLSLYAVKLTLGQPARLVLLMDQRPGMSVRDLLLSGTTLDSWRATDFLTQILSALSILHGRGFVHRGINTECIRISSADKNHNTRIIKLEKASWYTMLQDLHKSNPFGDVGLRDENPVPEPWLPREVVDSPLTYTVTRDISQLGVVLVQMLLGADTPFQYSDPYSAVNSSKFPETLRDLTIAMLEARNKRSINCLGLLDNLPEVNPPFRRAGVTMTSPSVMKLPRQAIPGNTPEIEKGLLHSYLPRHSRWREDWEELEHLGAGGFGRVVKARNRIDGRIYAVKKIKLLQGIPDDEKIFREVKLLSRLSHRHIVRYYTTWLETPEGDISESSSSCDDSSDAASEQTSRQLPSEDDLLSSDLDNLTTRSQSQGTSFPSIHFLQESSQSLSSMDDHDSSSDYESGSYSPVLTRDAEIKSTPTSHRVLYIQMEFVERQTMIERIAEGLTEEEAWRLFHQLLDALVHIANLQILHRDIKCGNIFIDKNGDVKIGDFGLATSSLASVPSDSSQEYAATTTYNEMTLDIGTRLYTAPEVLGSVARRNHDHTKADMYSLGIVFFEMNFSFRTQSERIAVLEELRRPEVVFPVGWYGRTQQKKIITLLLQHDTSIRPTAQQLSQSGLLPPKVQDEYFTNALHVMTQRESVHFGEILNSLFDQPPRAAAVGYDRDLMFPAYASLLPIVQDHLSEIFRLHGAVDSALPLLLPKACSEDYGQNTVFLLDRHGELLFLPRNGLVPMARRAAQGNIRRIKRYHIGDVYNISPGGGHPVVRKAAVVDIITPDVTMGASPATAELIQIADSCLSTFPGPELEEYMIYITHTDIRECVYNRIPATRRASVQEVLSQPKSSWRTKRGLLIKANVPKTLLDELETLSEADDLELLMANIGRVSATLHATLSPFADEIRQVIRIARMIGVSRSIKFRPMMDSKSFQDSGVSFQVVRGSKRAELVAVGGRYDNLIRKYAEPTATQDAVRAFALQIDVERISIHLAAFQSVSVGNFIREKRSFGVFSPRRCDVYVYSFQAGHLAERLEVAALLWKHHISADVMYDSALHDSEEDHVKICEDQGILFIVYPKPPTARSDQSAFKVKSVLRETETGVSRHDLVPFLLGQIAEQKKIDDTTSTSTAGPLPPNKELTASDDIQLVLLQDMNRKLKKPPKGVKDALNPAKEKASELTRGLSNSLKQTFLSGLPIVAVDIPALAFNAMISDASPDWLSNDEAWSIVLAAMPQIPGARANAIRNAIAVKKNEGKKHLLLLHVHDERAFLFTFDT